MSTTSSLVAHALATPLSLFALVGCGRQDDAPIAPAAATTVPTTEPVLVPASTLTIDGRPVAFPPTQMRLTDVGDTLSLVLYTTEAALATDPTANTVLLNMTIDADAVADLPAASTRLRERPDGSGIDTPNGLFLDGGATQLYPSDVQVTFSGDPSRLIVAEVNGTFAMLSSAAKPRAVTVAGTLAAGVEEATPTTTMVEEEGND